jgi:hypothetical protein
MIAEITAGGNSLKIFDQHHRGGIVMCVDFKKQ